MDTESLPILVIASLPTLLAVIVYFVRIEIKLAGLSKDICLLYKELQKCPRRLDDPSQ